MPDSDNTQEALLAGVAVQATHLSDISEALLKQLRMSKAERVFFIAMSMLVALVGAGLIYLGLQNKHNITETKKSTALIADCTQPSGECFKRGQRSQAEAITSIVKANLASSWCAAHTDTFDSAERCVAKLIKP